MYMVYWASKFVSNKAAPLQLFCPANSSRSKYGASDSRHTGSPSATQIRYCHTSDFRTFTAPQVYINKAPTDVIDLTVLPAAGGDGLTFLRFMKDESRKVVFAEVSTSGLFGNWTRPGGASASIQSGVEGPAAFWDNAVDGKAHLLLDFYGSDGYRPYESSSPASNSATSWTASSRAEFPKNLRHGSVLPINATLYAALKEKWGA